MPRPLIAILRGIRPDEAADIVSEIIAAGIRWIEVPLNSPSPYESIKTMLSVAGNDAMIGGGTVLNVAEVANLQKLGAQFVVSPNCNCDVIRATKTAGMLSYPGVMTPTECFAALEAGADGLKLFPGSLIGPSGVGAIKAVLPERTPLYAVGGAAADNFEEWIKAGVTGFGIGSALYKPGHSPQTVRAKAEEIVRAFDSCKI